MNKKYLAYISPIESIEGKEQVMCNVVFITGDLNHRMGNYMMKTNIFRYYYYGSTFEVIEMDKNNQIMDVHDMTAEDAEYFGISMKSIMTLNSKTFDMLGSNDVTYNLKQNKFYNHCRQTVENIYNILPSLEKFTLRVYIMNGAVVYIELDTDTKRNNGYVLCPGYVIDDKYKLKQAGTTAGSTNSYGNEKLKQEDIDKIITRLIG